MGKITEQAEKRKATIREKFRKEREKLVGELRYRRHLLGLGEEEYKGKNNRTEISNLREKIDYLEITTSRKIDKMDAVKHRLQAKQSKKHKWSF